MIFVVTIIVPLVVALLVLRGERSSRYPDGKCYMCRQASASPGDICPNCGTEQP